MNQSHPRVTFAISLFLLVGTVSVILAFWLFDHQQAFLNAGLITGLLIGLFLLSYTAALWRYLHWRGRTRIVNTVTAPSQASVAGTVYGLLPDHEYQVIRSFTDYYGNTFEKGLRLHFKQRHFLPYDGGHTIVFAERPLYLQEERNRDILDNFSAYLAPIE